MPASVLTGLAAPASARAAIVLPPLAVDGSSGFITFRGRAHAESRASTVTRRDKRISPGCAAFPPRWRRSGIPPSCSSATFSNAARLFSRATQIVSAASRLPGSHDTARKAPEARRAHLPVSLCETDVRRAAPGVKATRACTAAADSHEGATRDFRSLTAAPPNSLDFAGRLDLARSFAARVTAGALPYTLVLHAGLFEGGGQAGQPAGGERAPAGPPSRPPGIRRIGGHRRGAGSAVRSAIM